MSEACECSHPEDVFNRVCARCLNPIEKQMPDTQEQTNGKARVWVLYDGSTDHPRMVGPDIAYAEIVRVVELTAYQKALSALREISKGKPLYLTPQILADQTLKDLGEEIP